MKIKRRKVPAYRRALSHIFERISKKLHNRKIALFCSVVAVLVVFTLGTLSGVIFSFYSSSLHVSRALSVGETLDNLGISSFIIETYWETQGGSGIGDVVKFIQIILHPQNYFEGITSQPERLQIDIQFKDYERLAYTRERALNEGVLVSQDDDYVPATITVDGETYRVNIRVKGDLKDHWIDDEKWSFMVKMRDGRTLFGMRRFVLQHPRATAYLDDWYYLRFLSDYGLVGLRHKLVGVTINGENLGIYNLKEHYDKRLIEHNELREGPIFKVDDYLVLSYYDSPLKDIGELYFTSDLEVYSQDRLLGDEILREQFEKGKNLIESFRQGELSTHEVFDVEKLARFMAVNALFGTSHPAQYENIRIYYNPVTSRLEPLGDDNCIFPLPDLSCEELQGFAGLWKKVGDLPPGAGEGSPWLNLIFRDEVFFREYIAAMEEISEPQVLDDFLDSVNEEAGENERILHRSYPAYTFNKEHILYENQQLIREILNPPRLVKAHFAGIDPKTRNLRLQVANIYNLPVEILDVTYNGTTALKPVENILLQPKMESEPVVIQDAEFALPEGLAWDDSMINGMVVNHRILGASAILNRTIFPWALLDEEFLEGDFMRREPNAESFEFLAVDPSATTIALRPGSWTLNRSLIIPPGYTVYCTGGTTLDLTNGATILSYSPFLCSGTEEGPVRFISSDSTGQGLTVLNAGGISEFDYVIFENLSAPNQAGWKLTGAVMFYESPVNLDHVMVLHQESEDGLNIVRSEFTITNSLIKDSYADCFDADFSSGTWSDSVIIGCDNDGLDVSGSTVEITNLRVSRVGDKAISIGETSTVSMENIWVNHSYVGIATKDGSTVSARGVTILDSPYALAVYPKKPEYGPSSLTVAALDTGGVGKLYVVETGSSLILDGILHKGEENGLYDRLYPPYCQVTRSRLFCNETTDYDKLYPNYQVLYPEKT